MLNWHEHEAVAERVAKALFARDHRGSTWGTAVFQTKNAYLDEAKNIIRGPISSFGVTPQIAQQK